MIGLRSFAWVLTVLSFSTATAQKYPRWFLEPETASCTDAAAGYDNASLYQDSTGGRALLNAAENYVRARRESVSGQTDYLSADRGTYVAGSTLEESIDSADVSHWQSILVPLALYRTKSMVVVFAGPRSGALRDEDRVLIDVANRRPPAWVQEAPGDRGGLSAVGMSEGYFYESSSWLTAERAARLEIARQLQTKTSAMQKAAGDFGEAKTVETGAILTGARVAGRWRDPARGLFYVLVRADRGPASVRTGP